MISDNNFSFLLSSISDGCYTTTEEVLEWITKRNNVINSNIYQIPLFEMRNWICDENQIKHSSGKFYRIEGIRVTTNTGLVKEWDQPIINQPEIGFLGFITKKIQGVLHFLVQAKIEPGNINIVQLSPTLQATRSNYTCVHKGNVPRYLEYFNGEKKVDILIDQFQSEQGARFLRKRNRNIIVEIEENDLNEIHEDYLWLTLGQLKKILYHDNVINMDARTVISCINLDFHQFENLNKLTGQNLFNLNISKLKSLLTDKKSDIGFYQILSWITNLKFSTDLDVQPRSLSNLNKWSFDSNIIKHEENKYFSVIGIRVEIENREVQRWDQPMISPVQEGLIAFIVKEIDGVYHFLVQAKVEPGNFDLLELAPTVQCLTGNYKKGYNEYKVPFVNDVLSAEKQNIWYSAYQSEEGGRFFREQNLNMIVEVDSTFNELVPSNYYWMTYSQLLTFVLFNNYLNISARSLLAAINIFK